MANYKAKKAGQTLAEQKKLDEKYDYEERLGTPERVMVWMNAALASEHSQCPNSQWRKMQFWMRDGVVLCKFINKLRESVGMPAIKYQGNAHVPLVAQDNIDTFNKAAVEYGLPESAAFLSTELYEAHKGTFYKVIVCLNQLGAVANSKKFSPSYQFIEPPQTNDVH